MYIQLLKNYISYTNIKFLNFFLQTMQLITFKILTCNNPLIINSRCIESKKVGGGVSGIDDASASFSRSTICAQAHNKKRVKKINFSSIPEYHQQKHVTFSPARNSL